MWNKIKLTAPPPSTPTASNLLSVILDPNEVAMFVVTESRRRHRTPAVAVAVAVATQAESAVKVDVKTRNEDDIRLPTFASTYSPKMMTTIIINLIGTTMLINGELPPMR